MKRIISILAALICAAPMLLAQKPGSNADDILGEYICKIPGESYKVRFTKNTDNTYKAQIFWLEQDTDPATGKKWTDFKNPDKSLRSTPSDRIVLINGLKFNSEKRVWDSAKIYDPNRGIKANVTIKFESDKMISLKGTVLGIGETEYWEKLQ